MAELDLSRLDNEIELLSAMYPDQIVYSAKSREVKYTQDHAFLQLRLPDAYPEMGVPDIITASDTSKNDIRDAVGRAVEALDLIPGEEALDAIILAFEQTLTGQEEDESVSVASTASHASTDETPIHESPKTVIIWLHHLLATGKRKLALAPQTSVSGITKPGYPGVMLFTGPADAVDEHVNTLKAQNWQAFQVRYEEATEWRLGRHRGVSEVESMAEVVSLLDGTGMNGELAGAGSFQKAEFLKAVGIK